METFWDTVRDRLHSQCIVTVETGCLEWTVSSCGHSAIRYGRMRVKFPHEPKSKMFYVHSLAKMSQLRAILGPEQSISHLCNNSLCCFTEHLSVEPLVIDCQRKTCHSQGRCLGGHFNQENIYPDCVILT